ncbi:MAG TPA: chemotaxis protein CheB, partial [Pseudoxanthomonas sp.]
MSANDVNLSAAAPGGPPGRRVALLARPGPAREHLRRALHEAGAEIVLEDDPNALDGRTLDASSPQVVLVALESAIEDSLSRFDSVLHDPAVAVIFDEVELAARREGWEAKRWARHLSAKLNGHADVLPPGGELDATQPEPGLPRTPAQIHADAAIRPHLEEARDIASELPRGGLESTDAVSASGLDFSVEPEAWRPSPAAGRDAPLVEGFEPQAVESPPPAPPAAPRGFTLELEALEAVSANGALGAVVLFAGIGGPDAVRKLLTELPEDFAHPILVQLRLDGGRYDNLVKQMGRVSALPVQLAKAGEAAQAAQVYVLPNDVAVIIDKGAVRFGEGALQVDELIASLPPAESAVLLLSGSDP